MVKLKNWLSMFTLHATDDEKVVLLRQLGLSVLMALTILNVRSAAALL